MKQCHVCKKEVEDQLNNCPGLLIVGGLTILGIILAIIIPILMAAPTLPSQT